MSVPVTKRTKPVDVVTGVEPEQEVTVLKYLLSLPEVQQAVECGNTGDENKGRKLLLATILNLVHQIVNSRSRGAVTGDQPASGASAAQPPSTGPDAMFTQIVRSYIMNHARLGRKSAFQELLKMLAVAPVTFPESVARQLINIALSAEEAVRPCADLLADLICAGAMTTIVLMNQFPVFSESGRAPELFVTVISEVANNAPPEKVSPEHVLQLVRALGPDSLPRFAKSVSGKFRAWATEQIARQRSLSLADVERLLAVQQNL